MAQTEQKLAELGLQLPVLGAPKGNYLPALRVGELLFVSGQLPLKDGACLFTGPVGGERTIEEGQAAARQCALNALAVIKAALGSFEAVGQIVSVTGYVLGVPLFSQSPAVINGASDLLVAVLGDRGRHTRAAVSVSGLPLNATVEISVVVQVRI